MEDLIQILVVDDEASARECAESTLQEAGYGVVVAASVREAIEVLQRGIEVRLILSDVKMSGADGFDLMRFLGRNLRFSDIPLIFVTGCADSYSVTLGIRLGARDYIIKPYRKEMLLAKVRGVLESGKGAVMIAISDKPQARLLGVSLDRNGYETIIASSAAEVQLILADTRVDVLITEKELPGISGMDLMVKVKEQHPQIPVFFLLSHVSRPAEEELVSAGANGIIRSPFSGTEISMKFDNFRRVRRNAALREIEIVSRLRDADLDEAVSSLERTAKAMAQLPVFKSEGNSQ